MGAGPTTDATTWPAPLPSWIPLWLAPFAAAKDDPEWAGFFDEEDLLSLAPPNTTVEIDWELGRVRMKTAKTSLSSGKQVLRSMVYKHPLEITSSDFERLDDERNQELREHYAARIAAVSELWDQLVAFFNFRIFTGRFRIVGRRLSPFEPITLIPFDVWQHFQVENWWRGVAGANGGERLFSVYMLPGEGMVPTAKGRAPIAGPDAPPKTRAGRAVFAFLADKHPERDPEFSQAQYAEKFSAWIKAQSPALRRDHGWPDKLTGKRIQHFARLFFGDQTGNF